MAPGIQYKEQLTRSQLAQAVACISDNAQLDALCEMRRGNVLIELSEPCFCQFEFAGIPRGTKNRDRWVEEWTRHS